MEVLGVVALRARWRMNGLSEEAIRQLDAAWRPDTKASYQQKMQHFATWCEGNGINASAASTVDLVNWAASLQGIKPSSCMTYLNAVTSVRHQLGIQDDHSLLHKFRQSLRSRGAVPDGPREVPPLDRLFTHLVELGKAAPDRRLEARAKALVLCKLASLARAFDMFHWLAESVRISDEGLRVKAERTKGRNKERDFRIARCAEVPELCPVAAFERYWALYAPDGEAPGKYVWYSVKKRNGKFYNLSADSISRAVHEVLEAAGYETDELRPHGLRNAGASIARKNGASLEAVKAQGGWRSWETMMKHYVHPGDFATQVAKAIYDEFPDEDGDEASSDEVS